MLPRPRAFALVVGEAGEARDQQALRPIGTQAHIHVVQTAGAGDGAQQRNDLLREACEPARGIQRTRAVGLCVGCGVVQEHEVEVGPEAKLLAAEAAVTEHGEARSGHAAMRTFDFPLREHEDCIDHAVGEPGQLARAFVRGLARIQRRQRDAEAQRLAHFVERHQRGFRVVVVQGFVARFDQRSTIGQRAGAAAVQQFVEQERMRGDAFGEQGTAGHDVDQAREGRRLFVEEREVARAPQQRMQQRQQAAQRGIRLRGTRRRGEQRRQHAIQARPRGVGQRAHAGRAREVAQAAVQRFDVAEAGIGQGLRFTCIGQRAPVRREVARRRGTAAWREQRFELGRNPRPLHIKRGAQGVPIVVPEATCDAGAIDLAFRQRVRLRIAQHLQAVFQSTQEAIRLRERLASGGCDVARFHQRRKRWQQASFAQRRFATAADQLQRLDEEFDFANATGTALDVVGQFLARDFRGDRSLHFAQAIQRAVIEISPIDERPQRIEEAQSRICIARNGPRLLPRIAFPVASFALEVRLHRGERQGHAARVAERTQAQVDAMREALRRRFVEQLRQLLPQAREVILGRERTRAVAVAFLRIRVDEVDVGREIQFATAQLAEAEHHQALHAAICRAHLAVALGEFAFERRQAEAQAAVGELRAAGERGVHVVQARHVAPDQARGFGGAIAAQAGLPVGPRIRPELGRRSERVIARERVEQRRQAHERVDREVARQGQCGQALRERRGPIVGGDRAQAIELACDVGVGGVRHRAHDGIGK